MVFRLGFILGLGIITTGSLAAQSSESRPSSKEQQAPAGVSSQPKGDNPFFLLTGPKQLTPTQPTPTGFSNTLSICCYPPSGIVGTPYNYQFTVSGGQAPYTWTVTTFIPSARPGPVVPSDTRRHPDEPLPQATGLPPGLTFNTTTGLISGIPTQAGTFTFYLTVNDNFDDFSPFPPTLYTIVITNPVCIPTILTTSLPPGEVDVSYAAGIGATGCSNSFTYSVYGLPANFGFDSSSGAITGTPQSAGNFTVSVTATDNVGGGSASANFVLTINPPPSITTTSPLPPGMAGVKYTQQFQATSGTPYTTPGTSPYLWSVQSLPAGFNMTSGGLLTVTSPTAGTFTFGVAARDSEGVITPFETFQVTFTSTMPLLQVSPTSLSFNAFAGGDPPPTQAISVSPLPNDTQTPSFTVSVDGGTAGTASPFSLAVKPAGGTAPQQLVVTVDQGSMQAGNSSARIRIVDANNNETDVSVSLTVAAAMPQLQATPGSLRFAARSESPGVLIQDIAVTSAGGGGPLGFSASITGGSSWISISPSSGQTVRGSATFVQVTVNTQGLKIDNYSDNIHFTSSAGTADVPVQLFVSAAGPILGVNVTGLRFQARQGGGFSNAQQVEVLNTGDPSSTVNWTASLVTGASVFSLNPTSGTATTSTPGSFTIAPTQSATQASPGGYYALVSISDTNSLNSPQYVVAVLDLESDTTPPLPDPSPAGLLFTVVSGGSQSSGQTITVNTSSATAVPFQVGATTTDGANWLIPTPTSGSSTGLTPGTFSVAVNPGSLAAGIYTGQVSVSMSAAVRTVNITAVVLPKGSTVPTSSAGHGTPDLRPRAVAGCTPSKLALTETGLVNNFAVPATWPATLIVQLNDDCGDSVTNGAVMASFSNGDQALSLSNSGQGDTYSATWQPQTATSEIRVNLNATAGVLQPATLLLNGGVSANQAPAPVLAKGGTVAPFYRVSNGPLSPGTIVEVYGSGLASSTVSNLAPPLPKTFNGTTVLIGGLQAPLFFLSAGQLDVQIPLELPANQQPLIIVSVNGAPTLPDQLNVLPVQPVVDAFSSGQIVAQHGADFSLVTSSSPAKPGETIVIYLLGMGATNPTVPSGQPAPSNPLAQVTVPAMITVGGLPVTNIPFAGFTPGFAGLYQIDFVVPTNTPSGNQNVVITQNGIAADPATTLPVSQ